VKQHTVEPTRLGVRDLCSEALTGILGRPGRSALTVLGTVLGVAAFVAVLGLTATASGQIAKRFTALAATEVTIKPAGESPAEQAVPLHLPADTPQRLEALNGVKNAGLFWSAQTLGAGSDGAVRIRPPRTGDSGEELAVLAVTPGYFEVIHAQVDSGRLLDSFHHNTQQRVAVLGRGAANRLGIDNLAGQPAIFIGNDAFTVIGIVGEVARQPDTLVSVIVPAGTAERLWGPSTAASVIVETDLGAASLIGHQAPLALLPEAPELLSVTVPPDPRTLKDQVNTDLAGLFLALAALCLVIGAVGIANTTLVAVLERVGEIGLRRAVGGRRVHIAAQFLAESAVLGLLGGLVGTTLGVVTVVGVALAQQWTPILEPLAVLPAPLAGAVIGIIAGLYPSWRATRIEPIEALRR
jgi:putative ABC transport system permease protein